VVLAIVGECGDGYSDVIVGAPSYSGGESNESAAFEFLGSGAGIDLPQFAVPIPMLVQATFSHPSARAAIGPSRVPVSDNPASCPVAPEPHEASVDIECSPRG
jgi:hypothetical protein